MKNVANNQGVKSLPVLRTDKPTVLVLGGYGFVGRYVVKALRRRGVNILIGTRGLGQSKPLPEQRCVCLHQMKAPADWHHTLASVDVVINTVGILRERRDESFDEVHHTGLATLARACQHKGIRLVHMSALGIEGQSENPYTLSKLRGEKAMFASGCAGAIVRTSVVNAPDGYGSGWLYRVANWPVWLIPAGANCLMSPIDANDAAEVLATVALTETSNQMELFEIGCGESFSLYEYLQKLRIASGRRSAQPLLTIRVPQILARMSALAFDVLHLTPYSIGHHELLEFDNAPRYNALPEILNRMPTRIDQSPAAEEVDSSWQSSVSGVGREEFRQLMGKAT